MTLFTANSKLGDQPVREASKPFSRGRQATGHWASGTVALILALLCVTFAPVVAQETTDKPEPPKTVTKKPPSPLNDELLKGLGGDPLEDQSSAADAKDNSKPSSAKQAGAKPDQKSTGPKASGKPTTKRIGDSLDDELLKGLEDVETTPSAGEESDPFVRVNRQMRKAESLITQNKLDPATQQLQQKIVKDLEELIKQIQQQKSKSSSSKSSDKQQTASRDNVKQPGAKQQGAEKGKNGAQDSDQPAKDSSEDMRKRKAQQAALDHMQDLVGKGVWGTLPQKAREQMLQSSADQFLPKYQLLIEEYFKTIANQGQNKP